MSTEARAPERRLVLRVIQAINLAFLALDVTLRGPTATVIGGRLLVFAALAGIEVAITWSPRLLRIWLCVAALGLAAGFGLLALGTGGSGSPYLGFLAFLPIVIGIVIPDEPAMNVVAGLGGAAVHLALSLAARQDAAALGFIALAYGSCTFYGAASAVLYRRMRRREQVARVAQVETAAALARSELRRAAVERSAAIGRIAAELGHELSSPVASAAANLRYLEEELSLTQAGGELIAAVRESLEALERVAEVVGDLRMLPPEGGGELGEADLRGALEHGLQLAALRPGGAPVVGRGIPQQLPPVRASSRHLSHVVSILVSLLGGTEQRAGDPVALEVALDDEAVRLAFSGRGGPRAAALAGAERAGVGLALCRELTEPWGGKVEVRPAPGGGLELALTLRRAGARGVVAQASV